MKKRILSLLLVLAMVVSIIPVIPVMPVSAATNGIQEKIDELRSVYYTDTYFTANGGPATDWWDIDNTTGANSHINNIPSRGGLPAGSEVGVSGTSCWAFAQYCFYYIFGHHFYTPNTIITSTPLLGDAVELNRGSHYGIYLWEDSSNYYLYDANSKCNSSEENDCRVHYGIACSKAKFTISNVYRSPNYEEVYNTTTASQYIAEVYPSSGTLKVTSDTAKIRNLPCSESSVASAKTIETASKGATYQVVRLVKNIFGDSGNYWYEVETKSGDRGYIYSGNTAFVSHDFGSVSMGNPSVPTTVVTGSHFSIGGTIKSSKLPLSLVGAYVRKTSDQSNILSSQESISRNDAQKTYTLDNSTVASGLQFETLSAGTYEYVVNVALSSYSADNNQLTGPSIKVKTICNEAFTVKKQHTPA